MGNVVTVRRIWHDGVLSTGDCDISLNCDQLIGSTPRAGWLDPEGGCCGSEAYGLTLEMPADMDGVIEGVWIETKDGKGMLIDATTVQAVRDACNACCGEVPEIPTRYNGTYPQPAEPVAATYTFEREDNGDWYAYNKASLDYMGQYISGTFNKTGHDDETGITTYTFQAYTDPTPIGTDNFTGHTSRVFKSNPAPTLETGEELTLTVYNNGVMVTPVLTGATVSALQTAATGSANYSALGTWAVDADDNTVLDLTSSTATLVQIIIGKQTTPEEELEAAIAPLSTSAPASQQTIPNDTPPTPSTAGSAAAPSATGTPAPAVASTPTTAQTTGSSDNQTTQNPVSGDVSPAAASDAATGTQVQSGEQKEFVSNEASPPGEGEVLTLTVDANNRLLYPVLTGNTLPELVTGANSSEQYVALGTWSIKDDVKIALSSNSVQDAQLVIGKTKQ